MPRFQGFTVFYSLVVFISTDTECTDIHIVMVAL